MLCLWQTVARATPAPLSRVCARGSRRSVSAPSHFELAFDVMKQTQGGHTLLPPLPGRIRHRDRDSAIMLEGRPRLRANAKKNLETTKKLPCAQVAGGSRRRHARPEGAQFDAAVAAGELLELLESLPRGGRGLHQAYVRGYTSTGKWPEPILTSPDLQRGRSPSPSG